jgi:DNA polymerase
MNSKYQQLKKIKEEILNLTTSPLYKYRLKQGVWPIVGEGDHDARLMFVGEAPGKNEVKVGRPFVGKSGQVLTRLLNEVSIKRESVYITSVVKDRPPGNRKPTPEELAIYSPLMKRQIDIIKPKIIASLGGFALSWIWSNYGEGELGKISQIHGQVKSLDKSRWQMMLMPLYHPAVALYDRSKINILRQDMAKLVKLLA